MTSSRPIRWTRPPPSSPHFYRNWPCGSSRLIAVKFGAIMTGNPALSILRSRGCFNLSMSRSGRLALIPVRVPPDRRRDTSRRFIRNSLGQSGGFIEGRNIRPGAFLGNTLKSAAFIAQYLFASTLNVRPGDMTFSTKTRSGLGVFADGMGFLIFKRPSLAQHRAPFRREKISYSDTGACPQQPAVAVFRAYSSCRCNHS